MEFISCEKVESFTKAVKVVEWTVVKLRLINFSEKIDDLAGIAFGECLSPRPHHVEKAMMHARNESHKFTWKYKRFADESGFSGFSFSAISVSYWVVSTAKRLISTKVFQTRPWKRWIHARKIEIFRKNARHDSDKLRSWLLLLALFSTITNISRSRVGGEWKCLKKFFLSQHTMPKNRESRDSNAMDVKFSV